MRKIHRYDKIHFLSEKGWILFEMITVLGFGSLKVLAHHWPMGWQAKKIRPELTLGQLCFGPQWAGPKPSQITLKARAGSSRAGPWPDTTLPVFLWRVLPSFPHRGSNPQTDWSDLLMNPSALRARPSGHCQKLEQKMRDFNYIWTGGM